MCLLRFSTHIRRRTQATSRRADSHVVAPTLVDKDDGVDDDGGSKDGELGPVVPFSRYTGTLAGQDPGPGGDVVGGDGRGRPPATPGSGRRR